MADTLIAQGGRGQPPATIEHVHVGRYCCCPGATSTISGQGVAVPMVAAHGFVSS